MKETGFFSAGIVHLNPSRSQKIPRQPAATPSKHDQKDPSGPDMTSAPRSQHQATRLPSPRGIKLIGKGLRKSWFQGDSHLWYNPLQ